MKTWSLEEALIRAQSALAVAVQAVWDVFTNRPAYANDHPIPGCPNASDCRDHGCAGDCSEALESPAAAGQLAAEICRAHGSEMCFVCDEDDDNLWVHPRDFEAAPDLDDEVPNPYEPGLTDDELVGVRGLLQERYGDGGWTGQGRCLFCGATKWYVAHSGGCVGPLCPHKPASASSAVDASPAPACDIPPSPGVGRQRDDGLSGGPW